ncbi:MAG: hypothetical protein E7466_05315 [Ruminococcaceae bacterium]|nr:hypothetical protein [Oscillospiraceae bacterium]MBQ3216069.1 hypothetical protein [Oscillospiraceae bacterium]
MNEQLFRKKSIERVSSPEQLDEYIRVSNPGVWMVLAAIVVLLMGICVWGVLGHLDTTLSVAAVAENGETTLYVKEADAASLTEGMTVRIDNQEYAITAIGATPVAVDETISDYALHVGNLQQGEWVYAVSISGKLPDGVHNAKIVIESVSPMSFILN